MLKRNLLQAAARRSVLFPLLLCSVLTACDEASSTSSASPSVPSIDAKRWYSAEQVATGSEVFALNCAACHGANAQGLVEDWRQRLDDGSFPAPPLNGSAHAWHHPQEVLLQVINNGGAAFGGKMPAFDKQLLDAQKLAAIAYFQTFWSDEIYAQWMQMGGAN
jgi:mono/diheme cytochrome c family protein